MSFKDLGLSTAIIKAISIAGYINPTPIQYKAIPSILKGKDIIGCAQTGTGKTAAFVIPILQRLDKFKHQKKSGIKVLVISPTRELAFQIGDSFTKYGLFLSLSNKVIVGGVSQFKQIADLKKKPEIVIATPGRLLDLVNSGYIKLNDVQTLVLDEADTMLDMGFVNDIKRILKLLPKKRQTLFFSATLPKGIKKFALSILNSPEEIVVAPISSSADTIEQFVCFLPKNEKKDFLMSFLKGSQKSRTLVFTRTKHGADRLVKQLGNKSIKALAIHGNKSQNARQKALNDFKAKHVSILIATDIAARGIDIEGLTQVINYELPNIPETYVHRIGRTGRAGINGYAISLCDNEEKKHLNAIESLIGLRIPTYQQQH